MLGMETHAGECYKRPRRRLRVRRGAAFCGERE